MTVGFYLSNLQRGDEVAIIPAGAASPVDVLEIATVERISNVHIVLSNGCVYATIGGIALLPHSKTCIEPATEEHRIALNAKKRAAQMVQGAAAAGPA